MSSVECIHKRHCRGVTPTRVHAEDTVSSRNDVRVCERRPQRWAQDDVVVGDSLRPLTWKRKVPICNRSVCGQKETARRLTTPWRIESITIQGTKKSTRKLLGGLRHQVLPGPYDVAIR